MVAILTPGYSFLGSPGIVRKMNSKQLYIVQSEDFIDKGVKTHRTQSCFPCHEINK